MVWTSGWGGAWGEVGGGAEECLRRLDPVWRLRQHSEVELGDGALAARLAALVVDALAVAFHLAQVLVEDLARAQRRHQVVELAAVLLAISLGLARLALPLALLFQLATRRREKR